MAKKKTTKQAQKPMNSPVKEPLKVEEPAEVSKKKYKNSDIVEFISNGTDPNLGPARKPRFIPYATASALVGKGKGYIREEK